MGACNSLQGIIRCDATDSIVAGYRSLYKVAVENKTVTTLYESSRYYSSSECNDDPILITTAMFVFVRRFTNSYDMNVTGLNNNYTSGYV